MQVTPLHILLIGIVIYVAYRIFSSWKKTRKIDRPEHREPDHGEEKKKQALDAYKIAENTWDRLRSKPPEPGPPEQSATPDTAETPAEAAPSPATGPKAGASPPDATAPKTTDLKLPENFDLEEFLAGATAMYARIKESWHSRDMEDLKQFTTAEFFEDLRRRAEEETRPADPKIPPVNASLVELTTQGGKTQATVFYDPSPTGGGQPSQLREVWRFVQDDSTPGSSWLLENIQQVQ